MKMFKYVILDDIKPVIFDDHFQHKDMLRLGNVTSAGYFTLDGNSVMIEGEAISIDVPNGEHDKDILQRFWVGYGQPNG